MPSETPDDVISVEPHPRLLGVLGDIEFQPWQCLAELVDNAFDEFLRHPAGTVSAPTVAITLPGRNSSPRDGEVWVTDNGPGMTLSQLNNALRAGWTNNERYGQLGLFGVGFNIATARLGHIAIVRTARAEDPSWTTATLDLRALAAGVDFRLPVRREPKVTPDEHGTVVIIRDLKPEHHETLSRQQPKIRTVLGDVYAHLLEHHGFRIIIDGEAVKARRACIWGANRFVVRSGDRIPAVLLIDERLADRAACQHCGLWQDAATSKCEGCGSSSLVVRERRIWGWLGVQRYLHKSDYGIDFIRNGRKILLRDVSLFHWDDPDDPSGRGEQEYPIEVPGAGRLVGEIHVDHVRVNYQKNAFEYDTPDWKRVVRTLRGDGPLLPKLAAKRGYPTNKSPLARLFNGFRRNDPGLDRLIPGDGQRAIHEKAKEWAELFHKGDTEYQTDERWYRSAELHDRPVVTPPVPAPGTGSDILIVKGLTGGGVNSSGPTPPPKKVETEDERRERWRTGATALHDLQAKYSLPGRGAALQVTVWLVRGHPLSRPGSSDRVPVYVVQGKGSQAEVFVDADHPVFTEFGADTRDLVVIELAEFLRVRDESDASLSALFYDIKRYCLPDHKIAGPFLQQSAGHLIGRVRDLMFPIIAGNSVGFWTYVDVEHQGMSERAFALEGGSETWDDVRASGDWVFHVPAAAIVGVMQHRPESFLDGRVFRSAYGSLTDNTARRLSVERIVDLLGDVAVLADRPVRRTPEELQRGRLSCLLLEQELVSAPNDSDATGQ